MMETTLTISDKLARSLMCIAAPYEKLITEEREQLHDEQAARSEKYKIGIKERSNLTPPAGFPEDPDEYGDPVNYRYPIDDLHIRAALSYWNQEKNRDDYTDAERNIITERIVRAAVASDEIETVSYQADDSTYVALPEDLKMQLAGYEEKTKRAPIMETPIEDIAPSMLRDATDDELGKVHTSLHELMAFATNEDEKAKSNTDDLVQAHMFVVEEFTARELDHPFIGDGLDKSLPADMKNKTEFVPIAKVDDEKHLVYGVVYAPDKVDAHDEYADAETIEKMAHLFMQEYGQIDVMHDENDRDDLYVVESYIAPGDFDLGGQDVTKGSWVLVTKVMDPDIWKKVKSGELAGYSWGGVAIAENN